MRSHHGNNVAAGGHSFKGSDGSGHPDPMVHVSCGHPMKNGSNVDVPTSSPMDNSASACFMNPTVGPINSHRVENGSNVDPK